MALQGSGAISLGDVQTEFGGSNPISISEYYGVDTGVPGSGTISLSDFYGTSNTDVTANLITWSPDSIIGPVDLDTATGTISGINTAITLSISDTTLEGTFTWRKNSDSYQSIASTLSVSNGDTITIRYDTDNTSGTPEVNGAISVVNDSDSSTVIGTLSCQSYDTGLG